MTTYARLLTEGEKNAIRNQACALCLEQPPFADGARCHVHRIVRGRDGGGYTSENIVPLCPSCHRGIDHMTVIEAAHRGATIANSILTKEVRVAAALKAWATRRSRGTDKQTEDWKRATAARMRGNRFNTGRRQSPSEITRRAAANAKSHKGKPLSASHCAALRKGWQKRRKWWSHSAATINKLRDAAAHRRDSKTGRFT